MPWIPWYLAALPAACLLASWLGRVFMQLDDDQQPGAATSIRMPYCGVEKAHPSVPAILWVLPFPAPIRTASAVPLRTRQATIEERTVPKFRRYVATTWHTRTALAIPSRGA